MCQRALAGWRARRSGIARLGPRQKRYRRLKAEARFIALFLILLVSELGSCLRQNTQSAYVGNPEPSDAWYGRAVLACPTQLLYLLMFGVPRGVDPFDVSDVGEGAGLQEGLIHVRIQQRSGRKRITTVQGIDPKYDQKKLVKACKKVCGFFDVGM